MAIVGSNLGGSSGGGGGTPTPPVAVKDEGIIIDGELREINFEGGGVTATQVSPGKIKVVITSGGIQKEVFTNINLQAGIPQIINHTLNTEDIEATFWGLTSKSKWIIGITIINSSSVSIYTDITPDENLKLVLVG